MIWLTAVLKYCQDSCIFMIKGKTHYLEERITIKISAEYLLVRCQTLWRTFFNWDFLVWKLMALICEVFLKEGIWWTEVKEKLKELGSIVFIKRFPNLYSKIANSVIHIRNFRAVIGFGVICENVTNHGDHI